MQECQFCKGTYYENNNFKSGQELIDCRYEEGKCCELCARSMDAVWTITSINLNNFDLDEPDETIFYVENENYYKIVTFTNEFSDNCNLIKQGNDVNVITIVNKMVIYNNITGKIPIEFDTDDIMNKVFPNKSYQYNFKGKFLDMMYYLERSAQIALFINKHNIDTDSGDVDIHNLTMSGKHIDKICNNILQNHNKVENFKNLLKISLVGNLPNIDESWIGCLIDEYVINDQLYKNNAVMSMVTPKELEISGILDIFENYIISRS